MAMKVAPHSQISSITGTSTSDRLVSYPGHSLGVSYPSAEVQSVYFTAPADWASRPNNVEADQLVNENADFMENNEVSINETKNNMFRELT